MRGKYISNGKSTLFAGSVAVITAVLSGLALSRTWRLPAIRAASAELAARVEFAPATGDGQAAAPVPVGEVAS